MSSEPTAPETRAETVAAVDLGSNSFHMVVAQHVDGELVVLDRLRERVALAEGLDDSKRLKERVSERALACLARFGQRLREHPPGSVRAVGTSALRQAKNSESFLARAREALGHPIELVSGREEARLIYLGVAHFSAGTAARRLVVDIGGGSTECILGEDYEALRTDSLHMGCVNYSERFFPGGVITRERLKQAEVAAALEFSPIARTYKSLGWDVCIGSSGTILGIESVLAASHWCEHGIDSAGLKQLGRALVDLGHVDRLDLPGMPSDRGPVLPGGYAILRAAFKGFQIEAMQTSQGAMREGLLFDLLGRIHHADVRDESVRRWMQRYGIDVEQASRVERTAAYLLERVAADWGLESPENRRLLSWAARLHELGLSVNWSGYHKHGAYLVLHGDLPGFSRQEQALLASLILGHRRKLSEETFAGMAGLRAPLALKLCVLLRLAARLNRSRSPRPLPPLRLRVRKLAIELLFPPDWLEGHALTRADLEEEARILADVGVVLSVG
ncbi:MAG: Ppx/GppA family phosphatase [Planctomycetes bacterium]|nr:Ppx/GppA family phosphatase [Planctomycetota bacterium]